MTTPRSAAPCGALCAPTTTRTGAARRAWRERGRRQKGSGVRGWLGRLGRRGAQRGHPGARTPRRQQLGAARQTPARAPAGSTAARWCRRWGTLRARCCRRSCATSESAQPPAPRAAPSAPRARRAPRGRRGPRASKARPARRGLQVGGGKQEGAPRLWACNQEASGGRRARRKPPLFTNRPRPSPLTPAGGGNGSVPGPQGPTGADGPAGEWGIGL
jgi:hypothetical protein